jgi:hypothetical protein
MTSTLGRYSFDQHQPITSYCKRDISRLSAQQSEGIPIHAQQYRKQAGGVLLQ